MNNKSIVQLLIPFASTVVLFLLFWILSFLIWIIGYILFGFLGIEIYGFEKILEQIFEFLQVNIFEYREPSYNNVNVNTVVFWVLNVLIFIVGELWAAGEDFE